ncbi:PPE domain-containing protein [Nocardia uniformis]|uniref:PPE domain-containing protein n=1 Tax=Nocardia uniformis TaxID=53432 RepID=A0A849C649_9NOCA|nr:PPE domain-containing protein [Nocardia uniformis]NNH71890.1 PPE domain-containing protein [Nocardia uniformis]
MLEPTKPGFTETVWEARPPEQLARDLVTGVGAVPAAEAGLAWARLSAGFAAAAIEYERILSLLDSAWESQSGREVVERVRALRDWLASSASAAAGNAVQAETHAAAYEIARLAMPDAGEVEAIHDLQKTLEQVGTALGAPMLGKIAQVDGQADAAKAVASRVMRTYEAATESLATPWQHQAPPVVTSGEALTAGTPEGAPANQSPAGRGIPGGIGPINIARVKTDYRGRSTTQVSATPVQPVTAAPSSTVQSGSSMPLGPAGMGRGGGQSIEDHTPRMSPIGAPAGEGEGLTSGMHVAPAVLGGLDPNAQRVPADIAINAGRAETEPAHGTGSGTAEESAT